jgi:protein involved in polysaccharide export with SLBB domain
VTPLGNSAARPRQGVFDPMQTIWLVLLALLLGAAPVGMQAGAQSAPGVPEYTLGAGDKVAVTVFRHPDLSGEFEVDGAGRITLPLIGQLPVLGYNALQVEAAIMDRLQPDYLLNPSVSVQILSYRPFYIIGEVKQPGAYAYVSGMTVVQAVALAGGFTYRAKENSVLIQRAGEPASAKREAHQEAPVLPGDIIEVPERFF